MTAVTTNMRHPQSVQQPATSSESLGPLRALLLADLEEHSAEAVEHDPVGDEEADDPNAPVERQVVDFVTAQRAQIAEEIAEAIARMDAGTYGTCQACASPIPFERLEAIPYARFCIACQTRPPRRLG